MGRFNSGMVSVTFLTLLTITTTTLAQESAQKQKPAPATSAAQGTKAKHSIWTEKAEGIWEAMIPRFVGDDEGDIKPEFAVVRLTAAKYAEFQKEPKEFLNENKVFVHKVKVLDSCTAAKPKTEEAKTEYWYLVVAHWPGSTAACRAYAGWSEPLGPSPKK